MAYTTGSASNFADMKTAIYAAAVSAGYSEVDDIVSKGGCYFKIAATSQKITLSAGTGQSGSSLTGACPRSVKIFQPTNVSAVIISFPVSYEIHTFSNPDELYFVINYNSDYYQQLSFGKSNVPGIGGAGAWFSGSANDAVTETGATASALNGFTISTNWGTGSGSPATFITGFPFCTAQGSNTNAGTFIHTGLDGGGWHENPGTALRSIVGPGYCASLITALPNLANQATILIPVKCIVARNSGGRTIVAQPPNIRFCRIDNHTAGEIITFGGDDWKLYPIYRKNNLTRNLTSSNETHSGTFGMAIKYQGA